MNNLTTRATLPHMDAPLPDWLSPLAPMPTHAGATAAVRKDLRMLQCENMLPRVLSDLANGIPLATILQNDHRDISPAVFVRYLTSDPSRKAAYYDALEMAAELLFSEIVPIADGTLTTGNPAVTGMLEDTNRSKLRIDTRCRTAAVYNRKRFGDIKQVDMTATTTIASMTADEVKKMSVNDLKAMVARHAASTRPDTIDITPCDDADNEDVLNAA